MEDEQINQVINYLNRGVVDLINERELAWKIIESDREKRSMVVKYGVDPTAPEIHLGHTVTLRKLKHFQEQGHNVTFLIGDFTARIGDPSGRDEARKPMTEEEVLANAETYKKQIFKILQPEKTVIVYNSHWLKPIVLEDCLKLLSRGTVNDLIKRKSFAKRFEEGKPVSAIELIYPFLQGYDSVYLNSDVEIGGTDQHFNLIFGRDLQKKYGQEPQVVITLPLLEGLDGSEKMSKSLGNHVGIDEDPNTMYAKIMSANDSVMFKYFRLLTDMPLNEIEALENRLKNGETHPMDVKMLLARDIVSQYHGINAAKSSENEFLKVHRHRELPTEMPLHYIDGKNNEYDISQILVETGLAKSKGQAKRLISQKGVRLNNLVIEDPSIPVKIEDDAVLNIGKKTFLRFKYKRDDK